MKELNRIISTIVLTCFVFNTAVSDYSFAQSMNYRHNTDKLAPGKVFNDINGSAPQAMFEAKAVLEALLQEVAGGKSSLSDMSPEEVSNRLDKAFERIYANERPPARFFFREPVVLTTAEPGLHRLCMRCDIGNGNDGHTVYLVFGLDRDGAGGFPIRAFSATEAEARFDQLRRKAWPIISRDAIGQRGSASGNKAQGTVMDEKKSVMIVGGAGYIGSTVVNGFDTLVRSYLDNGYKVKVFDNFSSGHKLALPQGVEPVQGELADKEALKEALVDSKADVVIHFAAFIEVGESVKKPAKYFENNIINTLVLLEAMREAGVKKIVFSSSAAVYGNPKSVPIDEDALLAPINPYGETKYMMELLLREYAQKYGFKAVAFRYFNAAGADRKTHV